jgi:hypothetical protein
MSDTPSDSFSRRCVGVWLAAAAFLAPGFARAAACAQQQEGCLMAPCDADEDCDNAFLVCVPTHVEISPADGGPALRTTINLCQARYQQPCQVDSDCGNGFTCNLEAGTSCMGRNCVAASRCDSPYRLCASTDDCPVGWSCYSPCPSSCPVSGCDPDAGFPTACYPPFAVFWGGAAPCGGPATSDAAADVSQSTEASPIAAPATPGSSDGCAVGARPAEGGAASVLMLLALGFVVRVRLGTGSRCVYLSRKSSPRTA